MTNLCLTIHSSGFLGFRFDPLQHPFNSSLSNCDKNVKRIPYYASRFAPYVGELIIIDPHEIRWIHIERPHKI
jgi:hypothetical protein